MRPKHLGLHPKVLPVSSIEGTGIGEAWQEMSAIHDTLKRDSRLEALRADQVRRWFWSEVQAALSEAVLGDPALAGRARELEGAVASGSALPYAAARTLLSGFRPA